MRRQQRGRRRTKSAKKQLRNRKFWKRVVANRYEMIFKVARCFTKNISDAQDLAQTVVLRLLTYCPRPVRIINLDGYIAVSVKHAFLDSQRRPQREISFSDIKKTDLLKTAALDPNITRILESCDLKALGSRVEVSEDKLLVQTKMLIAAGFKLPEIAKRLNEPVRRTRHRWYRYRNALRSLNI